MTEKVSDLSPAHFAALWNAAATQAEAVERIQEAAGHPSPRWAVVARALALRKGGVELRRFPAAPADPSPGP